MLKDCICSLKDNEMQVHFFNTPVLQLCCSTWCWPGKIAKRIDFTLPATASQVVPTSNLFQLPAHACQATNCGTRCIKYFGQAGQCTSLQSDVWELCKGAEFPIQKHHNHMSFLGGIHSLQIWFMHLLLRGSPKPVVIVPITADHYLNIAAEIWGGIKFPWLQIDTKRSSWILSKAMKPPIRCLAASILIHS